MMGIAGGSNRPFPTARWPILWLIAAVAFSVGCQKQDSGQSLFPLDSGRTWTYAVDSQWDNQSREREMVVLSNLGADLSLTSGVAQRRRSESGVDYWLRADATGVYRVATKSDLDSEPAVDATRRYVLKAPIAVGTQWQATTTAYLLLRRNDFPPEVRHSHPAVPMTYQISAVNVKVSTLAGDFAGCVLVTGTAVIKLFADPVAGWQNIPLTTQEWYCPGAGLVRLERHEPANSTFLIGGTLVMDLQAWK